MSVRIDIGELHLHGFSELDKRRVASAIVAELTRLAAERPPEAWRSAAEMPVAQARAAVPARAAPEQTATSIAGAIFRVLP